MKKSTIISIVLIIAAGLIGYGVGQNQGGKLIGDGQPTAKEPIKIGAIFPVTGPGAFIGEENEIGATIAEEIINQEGGINGRSIRVILEDSRTDPKTGLSAISKLIYVDGVSAVMTSLSSVAKAVQPVAEEKQILLLAESSHPTITEGFDYTFRNFWTTKDANSLLLEFLEEERLSKVAVLYINDEFGNSGFNDLQTRLKNSSSLFRIEIVTAESFNTDVTDVRTQIAKIKSKNPDLVYIIGIGPATALSYKQIEELGLKTQVMGFILCGQGTTFDSVKEFIEGRLSIEPDINKEVPMYKKLLSIYKKKYPERVMSQSAVVHFDALNIIAEALKSGAKSGAEIRSYILNKRTFDGASGVVTFDFDGDSTRQMKMSIIENGVCRDY